MKDDEWKSLGRGVPIISYFSFPLAIFFSARL